MTIHPVIELKVGEYAGNKQQHRVCELNQDAYIFERLNLGSLGLGGYLDSGIGDCCTASDSGKLDAAIADLWMRMLMECHPTATASNPPDLNKWHKCFKTLVARIAEEGNKLLPAARHVAVDSGMTYPAVKDIDHAFIKNLKIPGGQMNYDELFDIAIGNVKTVWSLIWKGVFTADDSFETRLGKWNLDTGRDENNRLVFWNQT